jgi:hypothetical protein
MYENGKMRPVETNLRMEGTGLKGINLTEIYHKHFVNVTMYPQHNNNMIIKNV